MEKLWKGRFNKPLNIMADEFNSSISVDKRMFAEDIKGSVAHATMLGAMGIIPNGDAEKIIAELYAILDDIQSGELKIDMSAEDIHMFIESELTKRLGDTGKKLHTARSRNDQVALDLRLYILKEIKEIKGLLIELLKVIYEMAIENTETVMCGYTHLQRAQPITFAHHLLAYASMFMRDFDRLSDTEKRTKISPLGSCALAGTTYPVDRVMVADLLGFDDVCLNSIDGVSDRDFVIEFSNCLAMIMMHLSRFSEEVILWCSWEFKYIELDDAFSTGSSIMPQKKNPDIAELVRGKCGRVYGNLLSLLTIMKSLPLAYNKDMQEDKEAIFDSIDTVKACLKNFSAMLTTSTVLKDNMLKNAGKGFINATDVADYLTKKGVPFRTAYKITGEIVAYCIQNETVLEHLPLDVFKKFNENFEADIYEEINMKNCVEKRNSYGAPSTQSVKNNLQLLDDFIKTND